MEEQEHNEIPLDDVEDLLTRTNMEYIDSTELRGDKFSLLCRCNRKIRGKSSPLKLRVGGLRQASMQQIEARCKTCNKGVTILLTEDGQAHLWVAL